MPSSPDHYFTAEPKSKMSGPDIVVEVPAGKRVLQLRSAPGVFSAHRLDPGTAVLLRHVPPPPKKGTLLDLGCGYGAIACVLASLAPRSRVVAVDVNERALELTRANAVALRLAVDVSHPDEIETDLRFDRILSNPPIRIGKAALHEMFTTWLDRLTPTGLAHLVVQKHLGSDSLQRWLIEQGWPTERRTSQHGYRLLEVRPRSTDETAA